MNGPVIDGEGWRLRPLRMEDAATMIAWFEDRQVTRWLNLTNPPSLEQEREWVEASVRDRSGVTWVIEHEGRPVGTSSIGDIDWRHRHATTGTTIGDRSVWGRGIGGGTMRARTAYAFTDLGLRKLVSRFTDGNEASRRAQLGAGYRAVGRFRQHVFQEGRWMDVVLTEVLAEEWRP